MLHAPHAKAITAAAAARGEAIPGVYANPPTLRPHLEILFEAFVQLTTCRPIGMNGEGPIPWTAMQEYADWLGLGDLDDRAEFVRMTRAMDRGYLDIREEQRGNQL